MTKLLRITTVHESLRVLLPGQLAFMRAQGFTVWAASAAPDSTQDTVDGCPFYPLPLVRQPAPFRDAWAFCKTYRLIRTLRPHIVHTHTPKAGFVGILAAWLARVPVRIHTVAGLPLMERRGWKRWLLVQLERLTYRLATHVWPNSFGLETYIRQYIYDEPKLWVIGNGSSNGIDVDHFRAIPSLTTQACVLRAQLGIPTSAFVWVFVGRFVRDKGLTELVQAFLSILKTAPNTYLLLVGRSEPDDPIDGETERSLTETPKIISVGYQTDVRPYMVLGNAVVLPSYREGLPNVLLQAGCLERAVVAADITGCNEVVVPSKTGLLVPPKDANALQQAMNTMMDDPGLCAQMGRMARAHVKGRYERQQLWYDLLTAYQEALSPNKQLCASS